MTVAVAADPVPQRAGATATVTVTPSASPAFAGDAGDPDVVGDGETYYAFTTGTELGNHIQVVVDTSGSPTSGYASYTGRDYGSTALAQPPAWEQPTTQTSPGVFSWGRRWLMYYDAAQAGYAGDTGHDCISVATAAGLSPADPQFTDGSGAGLICQPTGSIDPSPFVDPATGDAYLVWKQNDGGSSAQATIWSQQLSADGTALVGQPSEIFYNDTVAYPWESTVEDPDMVDAGGTYYLLFSGGIYTSADYAEGYAVCSGPTGPCTQPDPNPILSAYASARGPGGGSLFTDATGDWWIDYAAWQGGSDGCTDYPCGATRQLYVAPIVLPGSPADIEVPCKPPAGAPYGYYLAASDGGIFNHGDLPFCGSTGSVSLRAPVVGMATPSDAGGYWDVASDGGIFSFGDAPFYGSEGGHPLNEPIVG
ncbi:MAG: family 43 glycosylhydrolase, partial [Acidimicrobiales bacterium]